MVEFRRINTTLVVILLLQFTAVTGQTSSLTVRAGHSVTLPCGHVIKHQDKCGSTAWLYSRSGEAAKELINLGKIGTNEISKAKSDRLRVTEECSLVLKDITPEDAGRYTCRQFLKSEGKQQGPDSPVLLSVIIISPPSVTQDKQNDMITLFCSVLTYTECIHTVEWAYEGKQNDMLIRPAACASRVTFASHLDQKFLKCNVTDTETGESLLCDAGPQSSGSTPAGRNISQDNGPKVPDWLRFIIVSVGLASLIIIVVTVTIWTRAKGNRAQTDENAVHNDEDEGVVTYENVGEPSASIRLH